MDWDRIGAWFWTVLAFFFILGFVLQSFPIVLTVIVLSFISDVDKKMIEMHD